MLGTKDQKGCVVGFDCVLDEIAEPDFSACVEI